MNQEVLDRPAVDAFAARTLQIINDGALALMMRADVADLPQRERYDFVTAFDAIHDQGRHAQVLRNVYEALRPDGVFLYIAVKGR